MKAQELLRGATPRPRPEGERGGGREEIPSVRGQRQLGEELPRVRGQGQRREEIPHPAKPQARGGGREYQPHVHRAVAARAQEGLEELSHVERQEGCW